MTRWEDLVAEAGMGAALDHADLETPRAVIEAEAARIAVAGLTKEERKHEREPLRDMRKRWSMADTFDGLDVTIAAGRLAEAHQVWRSVRQQGIATMVGQLAELDAARNRIVTMGAWTSGPATLLDVINFARAEVVNCRVVAWLLDPLAHHGLGSHFIAALASKYQIPIQHPSRCRPRVEVTELKTRADIVIDGVDGGRCFVIEAKIDAPDGLQQPQRIEHHWPNASHLLYLTLRGNQPPREATDRTRWRPITWRWLADQLVALLDEHPPGTGEHNLDARRAAADWAAGVRRNLT